MSRTNGCGIIVAVALAAGCGDDGAAPAWLVNSEIRDRGTLVVAVPDDASTLDPVFAATPRSVEVIMNTYEPLMTHGFDHGEDGARRWTPDHLLGAALESMRVSEDGLTWTLVVRRGVRFPSGRSLDAPAVKLMFERNFGVTGSGGAFVYREVGRIPGVDAIEVVDERTLTITTDTPNPTLPRLFVLSNSTPLDPAVVETELGRGDPWAEARLRTSTAGAGPYQLESWTPGVEIVLRANPGYWQGGTDIERVSMKVVPSAADRMMLLVAGAVDVVERLSAEEIDAVDRVGDVNVTSFPSTQAIELVMNNRMPPFDDVRVRRALAYAVPYRAIIRDVYFGRARPVAGPVPVDFPGHAPGDYPYGRQDLARARSLLGSAGLADGFTVDLELDGGVPNHEAVAVLVQAALKEIGVEANIVKLTPAVYAEKRARRHMRLFVNENLWWVDDAAYPLQMGYVSTAFLNHSSYANDEVDALVEAATVELDPERRLELLAECQRAVIADAPMVWITHPHFNVASRNDVRGYVHFNDQVLRFRYFEKD